MFGFRKAKKPDVLSHWYTLVDYFNISCKDFYDGIEQELKLRKVPEMTVSRVIFSEGGMFSANREYLRMKRERLVFDICAAPFGVSYFFSMRFAELPAEGILLNVVGFLVGIVFMFFVCIALLGVIFGPILGIFVTVVLLVVIGRASPNSGTPLGGG